MWTAARILVVDDEPETVDAYRFMLEGDGYIVEAASTVEEAHRRLGHRWEVILLDQKLQGPSGPDGGLELVADGLLTGAKVILVTGFATPETVLRAYDAGVYDYVTKGNLRVTTALLRAKIRRAVAEVQAERAASRTVEEREQHVLQLWRAMQSVTVSGPKGETLELLLLDLFRSVPGFEVHRGRRSLDEEFDLSVRNAASGWEKESEIILVEAKNWSSKVDRAHYDLLCRKLERRHGRCRLGFLVSIGGFTQGVRTAHAADRSRENLVVLVDGEELEGLVRATNRGAHLLDLRTRSLIEG